MASRDIQLTPQDMARLTGVVAALRCSYGEFVGWAVRQALDEMEGYAADAKLIREFYEAHQ